MNLRSRMSLHTTRDTSSNERSGVALLAAIVTLVILALLMSAVAWQIVLSGRVQRHRRDELQAAWLAKAGIEFAAAKLLQQPDYRGETLELIENSQVTIDVEDSTKPGEIFRVTSESRYPIDSIAVVGRKQTRLFKRSVRVESVVLDCVADQ